jgi:hypothetical protein
MPLNFPSRFDDYMQPTPIQALLNQLNPAQRGHLDRRVRGAASLHAAAALPGTSTAGLVLTGVEAQAAALASQSAATAQFAGLRGMVPSGDPSSLSMAMENLIGAPTRSVYRETRFGGQLGLEAISGSTAGQTLWLPTQYGPYMIMDSTSKGGVSLKVTGSVKGKQSVTQALAEHFSKQSRLQTMSIRQARVAIHKMMSSKEMSPIVQAATGTTVDYLRAIQGYHPEIRTAMNRSEGNLWSGPGGMPKADLRMGQVRAALTQAGGMGLSARFAKPESMLKGVFPTLSDSQLHPFSGFLNPTKSHFQNIAGMDIPAQSALGFETAIFGRPQFQVVTPEKHALLTSAMNRGGNRQAIMAPVGYIDPTSAIGKKLRDLAGSTESIFLSKELAGVGFIRPGGLTNAEAVRVARKRGIKLPNGVQLPPGNYSEAMASRLRAGSMAAASTHQQIGAGTALNIGGKKLNVAGLIDPQMFGGAHALVVGDPTSSVGHFLEAQLNDAMSQAVQSQHNNVELVRSRLGKSMQLQFDRDNAYAVLRTSPRLHEAGFGPVAKRIADAAISAGGVAPLRYTSNGSAISRMGVMPITIRGNFEPSFRGLPADPYTLMGLSQQSAAGHAIASDILRQTRQGAAGQFSRETMQMFMPFVGRDFHKGALKGFQRMTPGQIPSGAAQALHGLRTVEDIAQAFAPGSGMPWEKPILLDLPGEIRLPTTELHKKYGKNLGAVWGRVRGVAGAPTKQIALPPLQQLVGRIAQMEAEELLETGLDPRYLPKWVGAVGNVIEQSQLMQAAAPGSPEFLAARTGLETAMGIGDDSLLGLMAGHTGKGGMFSRLLQPRTPWGGVYATIQTGGLMSAFGKKAPGETVKAWSKRIGVSGLPGVGTRELGISTAMAREMGMSRGLINRIQKGHNYFVGGAFYPAITPDTAGVFKLKVFDLPDHMNKTIITNVKDRLAAFRDLDWDSMRLYLFPKSYNRKRWVRKAILQERVAEAWKMGRNRIDAFAETITKAQIAAKIAPESYSTIEQRLAAKGRAAYKDIGKHAGLAAEQVTGKMGQKVGTPLFHNIVRPLQDVATSLLHKPVAGGVGLGPTSGPVAQALGVAYQMVIKKGRRDVDQSVIKMLTSMVTLRPGGNVDSAVAQFQAGLNYLHTAGVADDIFLGIDPADFHQTAKDAARVGQHWGGLTKTQQRSQRAWLSGRNKSPDQMLDLLSPERMDDLATATDRHLRSMIGPGEARFSTGKAFIEAQTTINSAMKSLGEAGAATGGLFARAERFWAKSPTLRTSAIAGVAAIGTMLGLSVIRAHTVGHEPNVGNGMSLSPEMVSRMALWPQMGQGGAGLPPAPMVENGLHASMGSAYVPFSAPPARVMSPLQRNTRVSISATDMANIPGVQVGQMMQAANSGLQGEGLVGVMTTEGSPTAGSMINQRIQEHEHKESRFYAT